MTLMYHPKLDVTHDFPERTVYIWERSGWQLVKRKRTRTQSPAAPAVVPDEGNPEPSTEEDK